MIICPTKDCRSNNDGTCQKQDIVLGYSEIFECILCESFKEQEGLYESTQEEV